MTVTNAAGSTGAHVRKTPSSVSPLLVRCICITAAFLVTACGLLGLGLTCVLLHIVDEKAAPCPFHLTVTVFSVAGGLLLLSLVSFLHLCGRRRRLKRGAALEDLPGKEDASLYKRKLSVVEVEEVAMPPSQESVGGDGKISTGEVHPMAPLDTRAEVDDFAMTQKSADVSYWIEQQKPEESAPPESFRLEPTDGDTKKEQEGSDGEMTAL